MNNTQPKVRLASVATVGTGSMAGMHSQVDTNSYGSLQIH